MSTLLLVRHGQSRPFEADSDRLSERGVEQARKTGEHLALTGVAFDEVRTGTLLRHRQTAEHIASAFRDAGKPLPEPRAHAGWNEYPADDIIGKLLPIYAAQEPEFSRLVDDFHANLGSSDRNRFFQRMFERLLGAWELGTVTEPEVEPFEAFHGRVREALSSVTRREEGSVRVLVVTSGGPIGVSVQEALGAPRKTALALNFRVKNASISELVFGPGRVSLDSFNSVEHLPPGLRTFR